MMMDVKSELESALSEERLNLLRVVADVAAILGYPIYMVGGSVRDLMLGRPINDFDLTVEGDASSFAQAMMRKIGGKVLIHSKFKTARWTPTESTFERLNVPILAPDNFPPFLDFVTARFERYSRPGALPRIRRSSLNDDLRRRDFTINAMAIRLDGNHFGEFVDIVGGMPDLERRLIRVLHSKSFLDDPTRMFRAVRYAGRYEFQLEAGTLKLFNDEAKSVLAGLSGERLRHEFDLLFDEASPLLMFEKLKELGLLSVVHPALPDADFERLTKTVNEPADGFGEFAVPDILSFKQTIGWVLYLMDLDEKPIKEIAKRLAFPVLLTKASRAASVLHKELPTFKNWKPSQWTFYLDNVPALAIYVVWLAAGEQPLRKYLENWKSVKPFTTGNDLKKRGLTPGPKYQEILSRLRAAWLDREVRTEKEEIKLRDRLIAS